MTAQTIAEVKAVNPESLWHFLLALPTTMEAQLYYALLLGGAIGMVGHFLRGRASGTIAGSLTDYFFRDHIGRSIGTATAVAAELFSEIGAGLFTTDTGAFVGWGLVILSGIKSGYAGDSLVNKGTRPVWTPEQRAATNTLAAIPTPPAKTP